MDDQPQDVEGCIRHFEQMNWHVFFAETAEAAKGIFRDQAIDVAILDVNLLPSSVIQELKANLKKLGKEEFVKQEGEGFRFARWIRDNHPKTGVIMLSSERTDPLDRISGLECGADDYVSKGISAEELYARTMALIRRIYPESKVIPIGQLTLLKERGALFDEDGDYLVLTGSEQKLLMALSDAPIRSRTRAEIYSAMFDTEFPAGPDRSVDNIVSKLRSKVKAKLKYELPVETVYGGGYRLK